MNRRRFFAGGIASVFMLAIILDGKTALEGMHNGIELCIISVIPSLFPFFVLSRIMVSSISGSRLFPLIPLARICGITPESVSIPVCGLLGGYPVGAQCIRQAYSAGTLGRKDAERMLSFCNNAGPSFIFGMVGHMFSDPKAAWMLWLIHILSAIIVAAILPRTDADPLTVAKASTSLSLSECIRDSVKTMSTVCGWVVFFRVILAFLHRWFLWMLPQELQVSVAGMLELSNGCCNLSYISDDSVRFMVCSAMLAFGGLCVGMQTISVIGTLSFFPYLRGKLMQTILSICLCMGVIYGYWFFLPICVLLLRILVKKQ